MQGNASNGVMVVLTLFSFICVMVNSNLMEFTEKSTKMKNSSDKLCQECVEVENILDIDIKRLLQDLAAKKRKELTGQEKLYLCLSLCGHEPIDIAKKENYQNFYNKRRSENKKLTEEKIHKLVDRDIKDRARDISNYMTKTINRYIIDLMKDIDASVSDEEPRKSWAKIICFLRVNGYKRNFLPSQEQTERKQIEIKYKDVMRLKNVVELLVIFLEKSGNSSLRIKEIEQEENEDYE
jgi:hypothetical protein